jgi:hypothetical protein
VHGTVYCILLVLIPVPPLCKCGIYYYYCVVGIYYYYYVVLMHYVSEKGEGLLHVWGDKQDYRYTEGKTGSSRPLSRHVRPVVRVCGRLDDT